MRILRPVFVLALLLAAIVVAPRPAAAAVAAGFEQSTVLLTVSSPTALAFTPDETLLLIATKSGQLRIADVSPGGTLSLRTAAALNISARTCTESERGLLGVAADPNFAANRRFYVFYTYDRGVAGPNRCLQNSGSAATSDNPVNRVSRFTLRADGTADAALEEVLIDNMPSPAGNHNAGDIQFGKDGYLYISIGDGGCDYAGGGCGGSNNASRDNNVLTGKILRIIPDPSLTPAQRIPTSNPFRIGGTICALDGRGPGGTPIGTHCQETFANGLRNPFRMAFDPDTTAPATRFFINDVGQGIWEEINLGESGADYRWNQCEGTHANGTRNACSPPTGAQRNPIHEYDHNDSTNSPDTVGCNSITDGAVVPQGVWPSEYAGDYLFADYVCGKIFRIDPNGTPPYQRTTFGSALGSVVDMTFGPAPDGARGLYYAAIGSGEIRRITPAAAGNRAPLAELVADPQYGERTVTFDGSGSSDPDGDPLTYLWSFGDGATRTTTSPTTSYTYPSDGSFTATLQVRDSSNALSNLATILIDTLNDPPVVTISAPLAGASFGVGDSITLQGSATDAQDGALPGSSLTWVVLLHHRAGQVGSHTHPYFGPQNGANQSFTGPAPEDLDAASNSYLEIQLSATDADGATTTVRRDLLPATVPIVIQTVPAGLTVTINGTVVADGQPVTSWRGYGLTLIGYPQRSAGGSWLALSAWDDGSTATVRSVVTPAATQTYTATYGRPAALSFLPFIRQP